MRSRILLIGVLAVLVAGAAFQPARAQRSRTLAIRDGQVFVDGRQVPPAQLPASLDLSGIEAQYSFTGDLKPVLELNGVLYTLEAERLKEVGPAPVSFGRAAFFGSPSAAPPAAALDVRRPLQDVHVFTMQLDAAEPDAADALVGVRGVRLWAPEVVFMRQHAEELEAQALVLEELGDDLRAEGATKYVRALGQHSLRLREQAAEAAHMAQELPLIEVRSYLRDVEREDRDLFERLVMEREREAETVRLAREVNQLAEGPARDERIATLRLRLREIFELKQENRRREISQLEQQLAGLQDRLREREAMREAIIEARIRQLLESYR